MKRGRKDVAGYLYGRMTTLYSISRVATYHELKDVAEARGYRVHEVPSLPNHGVCLHDPSGIHICLRRPERKPAGHELLHAWTEDNIQYGIEYLPPEWEEESPEQAAVRFEELLGEGSD